MNTTKMLTFSYLFFLMLTTCGCQQFQPRFALGQTEFVSFEIPNTDAFQALLNLDIFKMLNIGTLLTDKHGGETFFNAEDTCLSDIGLIMKGIESNDTNIRSASIKYIDAASKIPQGILQGKAMWVGDYQECKSIESLPNPSTGTSFKGRYFTVAISIRNAPISKVYLGVCLPDSCDINDATNILNEGFQYIRVLVPKIAPLNLAAQGAYTEVSHPIQGGVMAAVVISGLIALLIVLGTLVGLVFPPPSGGEHIQDKDKFSYSRFPQNHFSESTGLLEDGKQFQVLHEERRNGLKRAIVDVLTAFSFLNNSQKLFGTSTANGPLGCLNGLRVISMWWVILGHTFELGFSILDNPVKASELAKRFSFQAVLNGTFSVDTFFFLSGLLVAYLALKEVREKGKLNWVYFVLHRYWRLTPLYAFVMLLFVNFTKPLVSGPLSALLSDLKVLESCKTYWWANFLYINNMYPYYGDLGQMCMSWSWYLANDMQFYLFLSPIVILLLWKVRKVGLIVTCFLILGSIFSRGFVVLYYGMRLPNNAITKHTSDPWALSGPTYGRPYARWSVYIIGILTGYVLASTGNKFKINKYMAVIGWCCSIATGISVVYGEFYYYSNPGTDMSLTGSLFYTSLNRTAWSLCLAWVVLACVADKGGPIKHILSWKLWAPLGRLTFAAYLVHPIVITVFNYNLMTPLHFTDLMLVYLFIGNLVVSYGIAFVLSMAVEAPMIQLEKLALKYLKTFKRG